MRPSVASQPTRYAFLDIISPQAPATLPTNESKWAKEHGLLARDALRNQDTHRRASFVQPPPTLFNLSRNSTTSPLDSFDTGGTSE